MRTLAIALVLLCACTAFAQQSDLLMQRQLCDAQAEKIFNHTLATFHESDRQFITKTDAEYKSHLDPKASICYVVISGMTDGWTSDRGDGKKTLAGVPMSIFIDIIDAFEHTTVASYQTFTAMDLSGMWQSCEVKGKKCASELPRTEFYTWLPMHDYKVGDYAMDLDGNIYSVTIAGKSGYGQPWSGMYIVGEPTVRDFTVTWSRTSLTVGVYDVFLRLVREQFGIDAKL